MFLEAIRKQLEKLKDLLHNLVSQAIRCLEKSLTNSINSTRQLVAGQNKQVVFPTDELSAPSIMIKQLDHSSDFHDITLTCLKHYVSFT